MSAPTYFDTPEKLAMLRTAARLVLHTPFCANSEAPGPDGGLDCVHTLNWVYRFCGAIGHLVIPRQAMDAGQHTDRSALIEAFATWPHLRDRFTPVWRADPGSQLSALGSQLLPGDALCFLAGKVPHHGGIVLEDGEFLHALRDHGVHTMRLDASLRGWQPLGLLAAVYRPLPQDVPSSEFRGSSSEIRTS